VRSVSKSGKRRKGQEREKDLKRRNRDRNTRTRKAGKIGPLRRIDCSTTKVVQLRQKKGEKMPKHYREIGERRVKRKIKERAKEIKKKMLNTRTAGDSNMYVRLLKTTKKQRRPWTQTREDVKMTNLSQRIQVLSMGRI